MFGYTGTRLCHVSKVVIGGEGDREPITLISTGAGENPLEQLWKWSIFLNLGSLPPTVDISEFTETSYSLHARAVLGIFHSQMAQTPRVVVTLAQ